MSRACLAESLVTALLVADDVGTAAIAADAAIGHRAGHRPGAGRAAGVTTRDGTGRR